MNRVKVWATVLQITPKLLFQKLCFSRVSEQEPAAKCKSQVRCKQRKSIIKRSSQEKSFPGLHYWLEGNDLSACWCCTIPIHTASVEIYWFKGSLYVLQSKPFGTVLVKHVCGSQRSSVSSGLVSRTTMVPLRGSMVKLSLRHVSYLGEKVVKQLHFWSSKLINPRLCFLLVLEVPWHNPGSLKMHSVSSAPAE